MWSGWLAGASFWALITTALVAENITCAWCHNWYSVLIVTYILLSLFCCFSVWPVVRYRHALTPASSGLLLDDADADAEKPRVKSAQQRLSADVGMISFSLLVTTLLVVFSILVPYELESIRAGNPPSWSATIGLFIATLIFVLLVYMFVSAAARSRRTAGEKPDTILVFAALFACCRTSGQDEGVEKRQRAPACFGDYPLDSWATFAYNVVAIVLATTFFIVALFVLISFVNTTPLPPPADFQRVLAFVWTAFVLITLATLILLFVTLRDGNTPFYDVFVLAYSLFVVMLVFIFTLLLLHADTIAPHIIATPLYFAFGISTLVFFIGELWHCQTSYKIVVDNHDDHFERRPDGIVPINGGAAPTTPGGADSGDDAVEFAIDQYERYAAAATNGGGGGGGESGRIVTKWNDIGVDVSTPLL